MIKKRIKNSNVTINDVVGTGHVYILTKISVMRPHDSLLMFS